MKTWKTLALDCQYRPTLLAKAQGISLRQLQRLIRIQFKLTPREWLRTTRMQAAVELLRDGSTLKEVVFRLGYKQAAHFSHDFKRQLGICPRQYLTQMRLAHATRIALVPAAEAEWLTNKNE